MAGDGIALGKEEKNQNVKRTFEEMLKSYNGKYTLKDLSFLSGFSKAQVSRICKRLEIPYSFKLIDGRYEKEYEIWKL